MSGIDLIQYTAWLSQELCRFSQTMLYMLEFNDLLNKNGMQLLAAVVGLDSLGVL